MRNISVSVCAAVIIAMFAAIGPVHAKTVDTDTNTKNQSTFKLESYFSILNQQNLENMLAGKSPEPTKTEDHRTQAIIAKWGSKQSQKWENLPKEPFVVNASAYTAAADECGKNDGITASGEKVEKNRTIACPAELPFGVKVKIADMGIFVCEDRGGAIKGNKIDIYMPTKKEAFTFGRRNLVAQIVQ